MPHTAQGWKKPRFLKKFFRFKVRVRVRVRVRAGKNLGF